MSEEATYPSPTTPGMAVPFRSYVVELVCLNMNRCLGPRFWADHGYWAKKYARECRGYAKFAKLHAEKLSEPLYQKAVIAAVHWVQPGTLLTESNLTRLDKQIAVQYESLVQQHVALASSMGPAVVDHEQYMQRNTKLVNVGEESRFGKIARIEGSGNGQGEGK
jgi:hypothetical protein